VSRVEHENTVHFEVFEDRDWLVHTDESHKMLNFSSLSAFMGSQNQMPPQKHQSRAFKKMSDLKRVKFGSTEGVLISDKMGEIGFINLNNVSQLKESEEESKN